ncbi:MAG: prepilin-type N-terminal cleavage/methylation domain-containing protein [bacterium]
MEKNKNNMITFKNKKGFTLIEVMVVTVVLVVGLLGILGMLVYSIRAGATSQNRAVATYLAQEGLEAVRNIRDTNVFIDGPEAWDDSFSESDDERYYRVEFDFSSNRKWSLVGGVGPTQRLNEAAPQAGYRLYIDPDLNGYWNQGNTTDEPTNFYREIAVDRDSAQDLLEVVSKVLWIDQYGTHTIKMQEDLYNWF